MCRWRACLGTGKEEKPDLVILDVQMPKLDGLQAAKLIAHDDLAPVVLFNRLW